MADDVDTLVMFSDDLEVILDVLDDDERIQNDFMKAVSLVSVECCIFSPLLTLFKGREIIQVKITENRPTLD